MVLFCLCLLGAMVYFVATSGSFHLTDSLLLPRPLKYWKSPLFHFLPLVLISSSPPAPNFLSSVLRVQVYYIVWIYSPPPPTVWVFCGFFWAYIHLSLLVFVGDRNWPSSSLLILYSWNVLKQIPWFSVTITEQFLLTAKAIWFLILLSKFQIREALDRSMKTQ